MPISTSSADWPITDYERGYGGRLLSPRGASGTHRYGSLPTLARLAKSLRRPHTRKAAEAALLARIADPVTFNWVKARLADDELNAVSIWARPGLGEESILAAWRGAADRALEDEAEQPPVMYPERLAFIARLIDGMPGPDAEQDPKAPGRK